jgi:DNA-directed RNA polymerase specialized sigma subunit
MTNASLYRALSSLSGDELYVIAAIYWADLNETQVAAEMTQNRMQLVTRDRVHRIRRTAEGRLRRNLHQQPETDGRVAA